MNRPRRTPPDANQNAENDKLRAAGCTCVVTSDLPGRRHRGPAHENPLDTFVMDPDGQAWLQIEWKTGPKELFTPNEQEYFEYQGIWDYVSSGVLEPLAQWRQTGRPIVVAWKAEQVLKVFAAMKRDANLSKMRANSGADRMPRR